jgi:hypothetical protein
MVRQLRGLSRGELLLCVLVAVGIVALALASPGGALVGVAAALAAGLVCGMVIAGKRARSSRRHRE